MDRSDLGESGQLDTDSLSPGGRGMSGEEDVQRRALGGRDGDDDLAVALDRHAEQPRGQNGEMEIETALACLPVFDEDPRPRLSRPEHLCVEVGERS